MQRETYAIEIAGLKRELRLFEIKPGLRIAILNILGDTELVQACARQLGKQLKDIKIDVLLLLVSHRDPSGVSSPITSRAMFGRIR